MRSDNADAESDGDSDDNDDAAVADISCDSRDPDNRTVKQAVSESDPVAEPRNVKDDIATALDNNQRPVRTKRAPVWTA